MPSLNFSVVFSGRCLNQPCAFAPVGCYGLTRRQSRRRCARGVTLLASVSLSRLIESSERIDMTRKLWCKSNFIDYDVLKKAIFNTECQSIFVFVCALYALALFSTKLVRNFVSIFDFCIASAFLKCRFERFLVCFVYFVLPVISLVNF